MNLKPPAPRRCRRPDCRVEFTPRRDWQTYCSKRCRQLAQADEQRRIREFWRQHHGRELSTTLK